MVFSRGNRIIQMLGILKFNPSWNIYTNSLVWCLLSRYSKVAWNNGVHWFLLPRLQILLDHISSHSTLLISKITSLIMFLVRSNWHIPQRKFLGLSSMRENWRVWFCFIIWKILALQSLFYPLLFWTHLMAIPFGPMGYFPPSTSSWEEKMCMLRWR
jgi:hypothetical protein